jgi:hypothetical protein
MNPFTALSRFLGKLFATGTTPVDGDRGIYFYVRTYRSKEVIRLRIDPMNDLTTDYGEDNSGKRDRFTAHKMITGRKSFERLEADFVFDLHKKLIEKNVTGGEFVEKADYHAYLETVTDDTPKT